MTTTAIISERRRATLMWLGIVVGSAVTIIALHALGANASYQVDWGDLWAWLDGPADEVLLGLGRSVALALAYWISLSTLLYTLARMTKIPALIRSVEWATLPAIRSVSERAVALSLAVTTMTGGAMGPIIVGEDGDTGPVATPVVQEVETASGVAVPLPFVVADDDPVATPVEAASDDGSTVVVPPPFIAPGSATTEPPAPVAPRTFDPSAADVGAVTESGDAATSHTGRKSAAAAYDYVVVQGDSLWVAAERHLEEVMGHTPSEAETATYWSHMIDANRENLRSGDPDLIFPGEVIVCPAVSEAGL